MSIRTVIDSCVLRAAFEGEEGEANKKALAVLDDTNREFIAVDFVALETIPIPTFNKRYDQVLLFQSFFDDAPLRAEVSSDITTLAIRLASEHGIGPIDALIASSAIIGGADELITMEKPTKPLFKVKAVKVISLQSPTP
ncbi:MAG: type II toxin-antitoxin system VapC family toxin [Deltaproteobacteria bacterium]|nr:type II toxin-antitoxin system VapC family toxin [Deltaproteobacteria bacterium]